MKELIIGKNYWSRTSISKMGFEIRGLGVVTVGGYETWSHYASIIQSVRADGRQGANKAAARPQVHPYLLQGREVLRRRSEAEEA